MRHLEFSFVFGSTLFLFGCGGGSQPAGPAKVFDEKAMVASSLKAIAEDKSMSDENMFHRYLERYPYRPSVSRPNSEPWAKIIPIAGGYLLNVRLFDPVYLRQMGSTEFDPIVVERQGVKSAAELCQRFLTDLGPRNLKAISYTLFTSVKMTPEVQETDHDVFRVLVKVSDLPKLEAHQEPAATDTVFDPRSPKIDEIWSVELNLYPQITYKKKNKS